jgi:hypothetical protein
MFVGVPVSMQLKAPLANHGSMEQVEVADGIICGRAALVEQTVETESGRSKSVQPISVWAGTVNSACDVGIVFDTLGHAGSPLRIFIPYDMIAGIFFAVRHVELPQAPKVTLS